MTQEQWYQRLKSWVPGWVFESENSNVAIFQAIAKLLAAVQDDAEVLFDQTMIDEAEDPYLSLHGDERQVDRRTAESDANYRIRIQTTSTKPQLDKISILAIANEICSGQVFLQEDYDHCFFDREAFCNRSDVLLDKTDDAFTLVIDNQVDEAVFNTLTTQISRVKAFGVVYRVVERY
jgi:hypothetical protein